MNMSSAVRSLSELEFEGHMRGLSGRIRLMIRCASLPPSESLQKLSLGTNAPCDFRPS